MSIPESDWKRLRSFKPIALERLCTSALAECADLLASPTSSAHECFLALFQRVHEKNNEIAEAFDDHRRIRHWCGDGSRRVDKRRPLTRVNGVSHSQPGILTTIAVDEGPGMNSRLQE